jgi:hypothetical protein
VRRSRNSRAGRTGFRARGAGVPASRRPAGQSRPPRTVIRRLPARRHPPPWRRAAHRQHAQRRPRQRARPVPRPPRRQGLLTPDRPPRTGRAQDRAPAASPAPPLTLASAARCPPGRPLAPGLPVLRLPGLRVLGRWPGRGPQGPRLPVLRLLGRGPQVLRLLGPPLPGPRPPVLRLPGRGPQGLRLPGLRLLVRLPGPRAAPGLTGRPVAHPGPRRPRPPDLPPPGRAHAGPGLPSGPQTRPG